MSKISILRKLLKAKPILKNLKTLKRVNKEIKAFKKESPAYKANFVGSLFVGGFTTVNSYNVNSLKPTDFRNEDYEKKVLRKSACTDALVGWALGFLTGGPVGSIVGAGLASTLRKDVLIGDKQIYTDGTTVRDLRNKYTQNFFTGEFSKK